MEEWVLGTGNWELGIGFNVIRVFVNRRPVFVQGEVRSSLDTPWLLGTGRRWE